MSFSEFSFVLITTTPTDYPLRVMIKGLVQITTRVLFSKPFPSFRSLPVSVLSLLACGFIFCSCLALAGPLDANLAMGIARSHDPFLILGVLEREYQRLPDGEKKLLIKKRYSSRVRAFHPDQFSKDSDKDLATKAIQKINWAREEFRAGRAIPRRTVSGEQAARRGSHFDPTAYDSGNSAAYHRNRLALIRRIEDFKVELKNLTVVFLREFGFYLGTGTFVDVQSLTHEFDNAQFRYESLMEEGLLKKESNLQGGLVDAYRRFQGSLLKSSFSLIDQHRPLAPSHAEVEAMLYSVQSRVIAYGYLASFLLDRVVTPGFENPKIAVTILDRLYVEAHDFQFPLVAKELVRIGKLHIKPEAIDSLYPLWVDDIQKSNSTPESCDYILRKRSRWLRGDLTSAKKPLLDSKPLTFNWLHLDFISLCRA